MIGNMYHKIIVKAECPRNILHLVLVNDWTPCPIFVDWHWHPGCRFLSIIVLSAHTNMLCFVLCRYFGSPSVITRPPIKIHTSFINLQPRYHYVCWEHFAWLPGNGAHLYTIILTSSTRRWRPPWTSLCTSGTWPRWRPAWRTAWGRTACSRGASARATATPPFTGEKIRLIQQLVIKKCLLADPRTCCSPSNTTSGKASSLCHWNILR